MQGTHRERAAALCQLLDALGAADKVALDRDTLSFAAAHGIAQAGYGVIMYDEDGAAWLHRPTLETMLQPEGGSG